MSDASTTPMTMAKLKNPMKQSFDKLNQDVKELHSAINNYSKALDKVRSIIAGEEAELC